MSTPTSNTTIPSSPSSSTPVMISSSEWHEHDYDILAEVLFDETPMADCLMLVNGNGDDKVETKTVEPSTTVTTTVTKTPEESAAPTSPRSVVDIVAATLPSVSSAPTMAVVTPVSSTNDLVNHTTVSASTIAASVSTAVSASATCSQSCANHSASKSDENTQTKTTMTSQQNQACLSNNHNHKVSNVATVGKKETETTETATKKQRLNQQGAAAVTTTAPFYDSTAASATATLKHKPAKKASKPTRNGKELAKFLKAVSVAAKESKKQRQQQQQSSNDNNSDNSSANSNALENMTEEEIVQYRKERNRCLAKQTRARKKVQMNSLKQQFAVLYKEHLQLQGLIQAHCCTNDDTTNSNDQVAPRLLRIPKAVWEATSIDAPEGVLDDDGEGDEMEPAPKTAPAVASVEAPAQVSSSTATVAPATTPSSAVTAAQVDVPPAPPAPVVSMPAAPETPVTSATTTATTAMETVKVAAEAPGSSDAMDICDTVVSATATSPPEPDEDSMLLMTILKEVDNDQHIISTHDLEMTETTTDEHLVSTQDEDHKDVVMALPPLSLEVPMDDDANMLGIVSGDDSTSASSGDDSGSEAQESQQQETESAISSMPEFSIPNPLAALVDVPETTAPAIVAAPPVKKTMSLFGKPVSM